MKTIDLGQGDRLHITWCYNPKKRITVAVLTMYGNGSPMEFVGSSKAAKTDKWDKAVGRKLALARAMEGLGRAERSQVWTAFFNRSPKGPKYL